MSDQPKKTVPETKTSSAETKGPSPEKQTSLRERTGGSGDQSARTTRSLPPRQDNGGAKPPAERTKPVDSSTNPTTGRTDRGPLPVAKENGATNPPTSSHQDRSRGYPPGFSRGNVNRPYGPPRPAPESPHRGSTAAEAPRMQISREKQNYHLEGHKKQQAEQKGYVRSYQDAQKVLDAYQQGTGKVLGVTSEGHIGVRVDGVTGFHNSKGGGGHRDQPTHVFLIKGEQGTTSVVPINPERDWSRGT